MKRFVLDIHTIYRRGLVACLEGLDEVESVADAEGVRDAWEHPALFAADLVLISERTVENVLHDVVTELNARSRSQAVAFAVREGPIWRVAALTCCFRTSCPRADFA